MMTGDRVCRPPLTISLSPPSDPTKRRALRILSMVAELHKAGYQRLRIAPGMSPSGSYWRCAITPVYNVKKNGWEPIDWKGDIALYSSADEDHYFGWRDGPGKSARQLARMFVDRFPEIARQAIGRDYAYAGWFLGLLGAAENGSFPTFYADAEWNLHDADIEWPPSYIQE